MHSGNKAGKDAYRSNDAENRCTSKARAGYNDNLVTKHRMMSRERRISATRRLHNDMSHTHRSTSQTTHNSPAPTKVKAKQSRQTSRDSATLR